MDNHEFAARFKRYADILGEESDRGSIIVGAAIVEDLLEQVLVDLGQGAFEFGQAYVALSRCRSIEGLRLARPLRTTDIKCHPMVKDFYAQLRPLLDSFGAEVDRALCANMNETPPVV